MRHPRRPSGFPPRCRACAKVACQDIESARFWHAAAAANHGNWEPVRFYQCKTGAWHWTHQLERRAAA